MYFNVDEHNTSHRRDFFHFFPSKISVDHDFSRTHKKEEDYGMMIHLL
jgi:hypothetical protein